MECTRHMEVETRLKTIEGNQETLRCPDGTLEKLWDENKKKVSYSIFFWVIGGVFAFIVIMQTMMYRDIDRMLNKIERMSDTMLQCLVKESQRR